MKESLEKDLIKNGKFELDPEPIVPDILPREKALRDDSKSIKK
jgi:hypothetical protein